MYKDAHDIAKDLGLKYQRTAQIIRQAAAHGVLTGKIKRGPNGRYLYSEDFAAGVKQFASGIRTRIRTPRVVPPEQLTLPVPLGNSKIKSLLMLRFGSIEGAVQFLKKKLDEEIYEELVNDIKLLKLPAI